MIKENFIEEITSCKWFMNCGVHNSFIFDFKVDFSNDKSTAIKSIKGHQWENLCLNKQGDLTSFLCINHPEKYQQWNSVVTMVKNNYMTRLMSKVESMLSKQGFDKKALLNVQWNVLSLFMANYYSDYYKDNFYEKMLKIYLSGYLPCGWTINDGEGRFLVY